jgi:hypothetical protein
MKEPLRSFAAATRLVVTVILASPMLGGAAAHAQSQPQISYIFPAGGQRGTTVDVNVRGRFLRGATGIHISGKGVTGTVVSTEQPAADKKQPRRLDVAANPDLAHVQVTVDADAEVGERDLRVTTPGGVSNRWRFYVGQVPEVNEVEPNSTLEEAQTLPSLPVLVNGQISQGDRDIFRFKAKAGETLVLDVYAQKILPYIADGVPGWFQPTLTLYDAQGREVAFVDDYRQHPDPVMIYHVEKEGDYLVEIKDALYRGRDEFVYRLSIGAMPFVTNIFPLGGPRGAKTQVKLFGVNLPGPETTLDVPADSPSRRSVQVTARGFVSNVLPFAVDDLPEIVEAEPNHSAETARRITVPVTINGRIGAPGDADFFVFSAKAKQTLVMEVLARRLDSPLDSILTLFNSKGLKLQENDDTVDKSEGLITHHADSYLTYTFPAAGDYILRIADVQGKGGGEYAYRLSIAPPRPDYLLRIRPDNPRAPQGGTTFFNVVAFRRDGFDGEIKLSVDGLPEGFSAPGEVLPAKQSEARMTISTPPDASLGTCSPKVVGSARIGDRDVVREAVPSEELMQAFYFMHNVPTKEMLLAVVEKGPFTLTLDLPPREVVKVPRSGRVELVVKAAFKDGVKPDVITLRPDRIPKEWQVEAPPIAVGQNQTTITITTFGNRAVFAGQRGTLIVTATMKVGKSTVSGFVPAIPYEVH